MSVHRIFLHAQTLEPGVMISVSGDEAQHTTRVKRLKQGDAIEVLNGTGQIASAIIERVGSRKNYQLDLRIEAVESYPPPSPRVEVWSAAPKGARLDEMIEGLSQTGCVLWRALICERTIVEPREGKLARLERIAVESAKQCGRAWTMLIGEPIAFRDALAAPGAERVLIADATGVNVRETTRSACRSVRLLVGPEGGLSPAEITSARAAGIEFVRLGPHIMRIETAAVVGCATFLQLGGSDGV
ncbi:MAG: 16S rRNA (uracil(1498)-N(3))-methyltransferase [Phycisphaeraceae bacterium]|nr:MAG: 16S rRNA (uracil(1498)-N(3))-methyltransferase [Phycisphaeraceae bacterium]